MWNYLPSALPGLPEGNCKSCVTPLIRTRNDFWSYCYVIMEKALIQLSASALRHLLIQETRAFIECLDNGTPEELDAKKQRLQEIHEVLDEKERKEMEPIIWSRHSSKPGQKDPSDDQPS